VLDLDPEAEAVRIVAAIRQQVQEELRRRGAVVGVSGGVDSAVVAALCVRALGPGRVLGLLMPERDSAGDSLRLGHEVAATLGIESVVEDIAPALAGAGCYARQLEAIRSVVPDYGPGWKFKLVLPSVLASGRIGISRLMVESPTGILRTERLTSTAYAQLVAATNYKQRVRKMTEHYHADRLQFAVAGTPNRLEYDQGFFVKQGDGAADFKPIAHLYKTQVYALAQHLGIPDEVCLRAPTTDTFPLAQTQEEFYFGVPYPIMDLCLFGRDRGVPAAVVASATGLTVDQAERVFQDIDAKRRATRYLHLPPLLVEPVLGV
jgi:NAD+ synthase